MAPALPLSTVATHGDAVTTLEEQHSMSGHEKGTREATFTAETAGLATPRAIVMSRRAGITLGLGLGGFVDGILLHQIVHWHNMGSAILPPTTMDALERNMVWDGLFHAAVWIVTLVGVYTLLVDSRRATVMPTVAAFTGQLILGWGLFNFIEGIIDHHLLNLHHVRDLPAHVPAYDWIFLLVGGVGFIVLGAAIARSSAQSAAVRAP